MDCFSTVEFCKFFIYSRYSPLFEYIVCKYFFFGAFPFYLLSRVFSRTEIINFDVVQFISFPLMIYAFGVKWNKLLGTVIMPPFPNPTPWRHRCCQSFSLWGCRSSLRILVFDSFDNLIWKVILDPSNQRQITVNRYQVSLCRPVYSWIKVPGVPSPKQTSACSQICTILAQQWIYFKGLSNMMVFSSECLACF